VGYYLLLQMGDPGLRAYEDLACKLADQEGMLSDEFGVVSNRDRFMIPTYLGFLKSDSLKNRTEAAKSLVRLNPDLASKTVFPTLIECLRDKKRLQSESPNESDIFPLLAELGPRARPVVPALITYVADENMTHRLDAVEILGRMGHAAHEAVPCLRRLLYEPATTIHETPRGLAIVSGLALWKIDPRQEYIEAMCKIIQDGLSKSAIPFPLPFRSGDPFDPGRESYGDHDRIRPSEFELVAQIGRPARPALARLIESTEFRNTSLSRQMEGVIALAKLDRRAGMPHEASTARAVKLLTKLMQTPSSRQTAAIALSEFGSDGKTAIPVLIEGLSSNELETRIKALRALTAMGSVAREATRAIETLLTLTPAEQLADEKARGDRHRLALLAVETLRKIEPTHPRILPTLIYYLEKHPILDRSLYATLKNMGPIGARAAIPALSKVVRTYAGLGLRESLDALRKIDPEAAKWVFGREFPGREIPFPPGRLSEEELGEAWNDLGSSNEVLATRAMWRFAFTPQSAVPFLRAHVEPDRPVSAEKIKAWIAGLDSKDFKTREDASSGLIAAWESAEPLLERTRKTTNSAEVRRRIDGLRVPSNPKIQQSRRRRMRAIEVLEKCGTAEATSLLKTLAAGTPETRLTRAAKEVIERTGMK
jgi:HEAT repeat protein